MSLKDCFSALGGDYEEVLARLYSEDLIRKFLLKFLNDGTYNLLIEMLSVGNYQEAFHAAHTLKGLCENLGLTNLYQSSSKLTEALRANDRSKNIDVLKAQVSVDYRQAVDAIQAL